ncbi:hypothetical protein [Parasphingorhabdus litoris]|uniref:hypothetical protein n=1 Tax=Parasphingorhabdus litoris TaxID=394733 RepID=UPI001E2EA1E0|nr:hypothetical protein [Parasphingorhabdus litoris]
MKDRTNSVSEVRRQGGKARLAVQTWIGVYPVLTLIAVALEPVLNDLPIPLRTMVMSILMVPMMVFWIMPLISKIGLKS